jgi:hypothetical protein
MSADSLMKSLIFPVLSKDSSSMSSLSFARPYMRSIVSFEVAQLLAHLVLA